MTSEQVKIKLTVVVPVYNSEDFILRALNSIPIRDDIEVIIIEDCSTDKSYEICKDWAKDRNNCILLRNDVNRGVGYNKRIAYEMARGEYIVTVDSDDWCNTDDYNLAIDTLYRLNQDRIIFPAVYNDGHISSGEVRTATWGQFLKKDFLMKNNLNFNPEHLRAEDWYLMIELRKIPHTEIRITGIVPYHYNENREGSLTWRWKHGEFPED